MHGRHGNSYPASSRRFAADCSFIARDNCGRAQSFGNELIDKALSLANMSERGRTVPELNEPDVREIIHGSYRIIYELLQGKIYVLRFWHGARGKPIVKRAD